MIICIKNILRLVINFRHLPKTIFFNFRYFPFNIAIRLPVMVSANVRLLKTKGQVLINAPISHRMIRIGFGNVGIFDRAGSKSIWEMKSGKVQFNGGAIIGHGSKICVMGGNLTLGNNFIVTAETQLVCAKSIEFGDDCLLSWQILVMDTDFHKLYNHSNYQINKDCPIKIGNKNWIGCRSLILKGSVTADNCVIAAGSTVTKHIATSDAVLAGSPASPVKTEIHWHH